MTGTSAKLGVGLQMPTLAEVGDILKRGDILLAVGVMTILVVLILPLPPILLDFALAISIIFSVLILMTALFIHDAARILDLPDRAADRDHAAAGAQSRVNAPDSRARP